MALLNDLAGKLPVEKLSGPMQSGEEAAVKSVLADYLEKAGIAVYKSYLKKAAASSTTNRR